MYTIIISAQDLSDVADGCGIHSASLLQMATKLLAMWLLLTLQSRLGPNRLQNQVEHSLVSHVTGNFLSSDF